MNAMTHVDSIRPNFQFDIQITNIKVRIMDVIQNIAIKVT